jgi:DNA-directed RNA polymerase specialized sigma24 family protein
LAFLPLCPLDARLQAHPAPNSGAISFPRLKDREDLWAILFTLTMRQAGMQNRERLRHKRGGGEVRGGSALVDEAGRPLDPAGEGPTPDEEVALQESMARLLAALKDDELRRIAVARLEGGSNAEIAREIGRAEVTVERRLKLIRESWRQAGFVEEGGGMA